MDPVVVVAHTEEERGGLIANVVAVVLVVLGLVGAMVGVVFWFHHDDMRVYCQDVARKRQRRALGEAHDAYAAAEAAVGGTPLPLPDVPDTDDCQADVDRLVAATLSLVYLRQAILSVQPAYLAYRQAAEAVGAPVGEGEAEVGRPPVQNPPPDPEGRTRAYLALAREFAARAAQCREPQRRARRAYQVYTDNTRDVPCRPEPSDLPDRVPGGCPTQAEVYDGLRKKWEARTQKVVECALDLVACQASANQAFQRFRTAAEGRGLPLPDPPAFLTGAAAANVPCEDQLARCREVQAVWETNLQRLA